MKRKDFLKSLALLPLAAAATRIDALARWGEDLEDAPQLPALFLGHGSPMNAIEENEFVEGFRKCAQGLERPKAILCISAHWETRGSFVTAMPKPRTIHDFGGFPKELFAVQYPAAGSPEWAEQIKQAITHTQIGLDHSWGLDHGAWSVIKHLYPEADVPVLQLSIDYTKPPQYHYELAQQLAQLRRKGVLLVGSGNIVHNLGLVAWDKLHEADFGFDWAQEANAFVKKQISERAHAPLIGYHKQGAALAKAIPTPEHYLPLLYILATQGTKEEATFFNDKAVAGALTMTSVKIGA